MKGSKRVVDCAENSDRILANNANNSLSRVPVPKFRRSCGFPIAGHDPPKCFEDAVFVRTDHDVRSLCERDRPFRVVAQSEARYSEYRCFLLKSARVRQYDRGIGLEVQEFK